MTPDELKTWAEIFQSIVTTLAVIIAGVWSYFTFIRGRTFAANVKISVVLKQAIVLEGKKAAIVTVSIENIGRTKVKKQSCDLATTSTYDNGRMFPGRSLSRIDTSFDFSEAENVYSIFEWTDILEPAEVSSTDVLIHIGDQAAITVGVKFTGERNRIHSWLTHGVRDQWISTAILCVSSK